MKEYKIYNHKFLFLDIGNRYMVLDHNGHQIEHGKLEEEPTEEDAAVIVLDAMNKTYL